jgi:hypothetical protein
MGRCQEHDSVNLGYSFYGSFAPEVPMTREATYV